MRWRLFFLGFARTLFVIYCIEAGALLILTPWREEWIRFAAAVPFDGLQPLVLLHPVLRGAVTGFGLVHLVWGIHDLEDLLSRRFRGQEPTAS
jgi:hypothetical protein